MNMNFLINSIDICFYLPFSNNNIIENNIQKKNIYIIYNLLYSQISNNIISQLLIEIKVRKFLDKKQDEL